MLGSDLKLKITVVKRDIKMTKYIESENLKVPKHKKLSSASFSQKQLGVREIKQQYEPSSPDVFQFFSQVLRHESYADVS